MTVKDWTSWNALAKHIAAWCKSNRQISLSAEKLYGLEILMKRQTHKYKIIFAVQTNDIKRQKQFVMNILIIKMNAFYKRQ